MFSGLYLTCATLTFVFMQLCEQVHYHVQTALETLVPMKVNLNITSYSAYKKIIINFCDFMIPKNLWPVLIWVWWSDVQKHLAI